VFKTDSAGVVENPHIVDTTEIREGFTYGSVSILPVPNGLELYFTRHTTGSIWEDMDVDIMMIRATEVGVMGPLNTMPIDFAYLNSPWPLATAPEVIWSDPRIIGTYRCRRTDDKLTVVIAGKTRYLVQSFMRDDRDLHLVPSIMYGFMPYQGTWAFSELRGDANWGYTEPTLSVAFNQAYVGYLKHQRLTGRYSNLGKLCVAAISMADLSLIPQTGAFSDLKFSSLRGSKDLTGASSKWMFVGETGVEGQSEVGGLPTFVSYYLVAPIPSIQPRTGKIIRGVPFRLDGYQTYDPDRIPLNYSWAHTDPSPLVTISPATGVETYVLVPKAVGPNARSFSVILTVNDGMHGPITDAVAYTVDAMPLPSITFDSAVGGIINVVRNTVVTVKATVSTNANQDVRLKWTQVSGTPMELEGTDTDTLVMYLYRPHVSGENIVLRLAVYDDINTAALDGTTPCAVSETLTLVVPAIDATLLEPKSVKRSFFNIENNRASISQRHCSGVWDQPQLETLVGSDFFRVKMTGGLQQERVVYISERSVIATAQSSLASGVHFYCRRFTLLGTTIADADHAENDVTWVLTSGGTTLFYSSPGPDYQSDWPDHFLDFSKSYGTYHKLFVTNLFDGHRVLCYSGESGVLLAQIYEPDMTVEAIFAISTHNNILYGADHVTFVRLADVESTQTGKVLVGTVDSDGKYYETLVDLPRRRIISTWDSSSTHSRTILTGEILATAGAVYEGRLKAPTAIVVEQEPGTANVNVTWKQERADLVDEYEVWGQVNASTEAMLARAVGGAATHATILGVHGNTYTVRVRAKNTDGYGPFSQMAILIVP
jgi:hypothetical protein